jgi:hypothetical protein
MNLKWNVFMVLVMTGYSVIASGQAVTGKIMIDGQIYSSGSSNVVQGSGKVITVKRQLNTFHNLSINIAADIEYIASNDYKLELSADDNVAAVITSAISGDTLLIDTDRSFSTQSRIHIKIYGASTLNSLRVGGSSDINLNGITGDSLEITVNGTGDVVAEGNIKNLIVHVVGSGNIRSKALQADNVTVDVDGTADVTVTANNRLNVMIDGVSNVTYYGHPTIRKTINGVGNISAGY